MLTERRHQPVKTHQPVKPEIKEYISQVQEDRMDAFLKLRNLILEALPPGFEEGIQYGMISYFVPLSRYPDGYHCSPNTALPFLSIASQKNFIGFYHFGLYVNPSLYEWFREEYPKHAKYKLDMGKSCVRFKRMDDIPYDLLRATLEKMDVDTWIELYEAQLKR